MLALYTHILNYVWKHQRTLSLNWSFISSYTCSFKFCGYWWNFVFTKETFSSLHGRTSSPTWSLMFPHMVKDGQWDASYCLINDTLGLQIRTLITRIHFNSLQMLASNCSKWHLVLCWHCYLHSMVVVSLIRSLWLHFSSALWWYCGGGWDFTRWGYYSRCVIINEHDNLLCNL